MLVERDIKEPKNLKTLLNTELARLKENPYYKKGHILHSDNAKTL